MPTYGGKDSRGKIITVKPYELEGDDKLLWLTERQRGLLLAMTEYLDWKTRWAELPSPLDDDDVRDSYVSGLKNRLMIVVEFCAEVINCIDTDEDTRNALTRIINNVMGGSSNFPMGEELPESEYTRDLAGDSNPACDSVKLGRQCSAIVRFFDDGNTQFFQQIAVAANVISLAKQIADAPFVNLIIRQSGITSALEFVEYMAEAVKEQYEAGVDETYLDNLARQLYCLCEDDCKVTLDRFFQMTAENVNELIPKNISEGLETLIDILEIFTGLDTVGTDTADIMFWLDGILAKVVSVITFGIANKGLDFMLNSAANDASFDLDLTGLDCGYKAHNVGIIGRDGEGNVFTVPFESGVPFTIAAYDMTTTVLAYAIALKLPPGDWNVALDSFNGDVTPPVDLTETAYAWHDMTPTFHNVLWNVPAAPDDFTNQNTTKAVFNTWSSTAEWNVVLFNSSPFTATFTATLIP